MTLCSSTCIILLVYKGKILISDKNQSLSMQTVKKDKLKKNAENVTVLLNCGIASVSSYLFITPNSTINIYDITVF